MATAYPAIITPDVEEGSGYIIEFPDLDGCYTAGRTKDEALAMGREALTGWLESELSRNHDIPEPGVPGPGMVLVEPEPHVAVPLMLKQARKQAGLSQTEMAKKMGIAYTSYQHLEYPKRFNATVRSLERATKALGLQLKIEFRP